MDDDHINEGFESDREEAPLKLMRLSHKEDPIVLDAAFLESCPMHRVLLEDIRPTQIAVGMQQVPGTVGIYHG